MTGDEIKTEVASQDGRRLLIAGNDDAVLAMLSGATFGPDASLILPSGARLDGNQAQAWTSVYRDEERGDSVTER